MYQMPRRSPAVAKSRPKAVAEGKAVVSDVVVATPATRRFRAVITRNIRQTAVVEFTAPETANHYEIAEDLLSQIGDEQWTASAPSGGWVDRIELVEAG